MLTLSTLVIFLAAVGCGIARRWGWGVFLFVVTVGILVGASGAGA